MRGFLLSGSKGRREAGFSLVQVATGISVLGVLGALGIANLSEFLHQNALKGEAQSLAGLMRQSRSVGIKKNLGVGILFAADPARCRVFEDLDGDGNWQAGEPRREVALGKEMRLGPGEDAPSAGPLGGSLPASGLAGSWSDRLLFARDPMATPSEGALYFHHARLPGWTACLIRPAGSQQIQAYLWDGNSWRSL